MTREVGMELDFGRSTRDMALGLRSSRPPDSVGSTPGKKEKRLDGKGKTPRRDQREEEEDVEISDAEWQIRTGAFSYTHPTIVSSTVADGLL
jgi:hypothetical protein